MLGKLERITMIHSNTTDVVSVFKSTPCRNQAWTNEQRVGTVRSVQHRTASESKLALACCVQDAFKETISFAVLRLLVGACRVFETRVCLEHETIFVSNVRSALDYLCDTNISRASTAPTRPRPRAGSAI